MFGQNNHKKPLNLNEINFDFIRKITIFGENDYIKNLVGVVLTRTILKSKYQINTRISENKYEISFSNYEIYSIKDKNDISVILDSRQANSAIKSTASNGVIIYTSNRTKLKSKQLKNLDLIPIDVEIKSEIDDFVLNESIHFIYAIAKVAGLNNKLIKKHILENLSSEASFTQIKRIKKYINIFLDEFSSMKKLELTEVEDPQNLDTSSKKNEIFISGLELLSLIISSLDLDFIFYNNEKKENSYLNEFFYTLSIQKSSTQEIVILDKSISCLNNDLFHTFLGYKNISILHSSQLDNPSIELLNFSYHSLLPVNTILIYNQEDKLTLDQFLNKFKGLVFFISDIKEISTFFLVILENLLSENLNFVIIISEDTLLSNKSLKINQKSFIKKLSKLSNLENIITKSTLERLSPFNYYQIASDSGNLRSTIFHQKGETTYYYNNQSEKRRNILIKYKRKIKEKFEDYEIYGSINSSINFITYGLNKNLCLELMRFLQTRNTPSSLIYFKSNQIHSEPLQLCQKKSKNIVIGNDYTIFLKIYNALRDNQTRIHNTLELIEINEISVLIKKISKII